MSKVSFKLLRKPAEDEKVAKTKQVAVILSHMQVGHVITRESLVEKVDGDKEFVSKQGAAKVINFYVPKLKDAGLIEKIVEEDPAEENEEKPKDEKKPKGNRKPKGKDAGEAHPDEADAPELAGDEAELEGEDAA